MVSTFQQSCTLHELNYDCIIWLPPELQHTYNLTLTNLLTQIGTLLLVSAYIQIISLVLQHLI